MKKWKGIKGIVSMILSLMLIFTMVFGITGCSSGDEPVDGDPVEQGTGGGSTSDPNGGQTSAGGKQGQSSDGTTATDQPAPGGTYGETGAEVTDDQPIIQ